MGELKRQKISKDTTQKDSDYQLTNPNGCEIKNLHKQTLQPVNLNSRVKKLGEHGNVKKSRDTRIPHNWSKIFKVNPSEFSLSDFSDKGFANIYFNRIEGYPNVSDKLYIRILDATINSQGFFTQTDSKYNKKPSKTLLLGICRAGSVVENLLALEDYVEKSVSEQMVDSDNSLVVSCKQYLKLFGGNDPIEQIVYYDMYVNWPRFNEKIPVIVDGMEKQFTADEFNQYCLNSSYDVTLSVNPWIRHDKERNAITVGFNYYVEDVDVRRNASASEIVVG